ncbi:MAG: hypothetical protein EZS28_000203 [Streblomastix strix]|uniref:Uncharacterized protein n=1 Tax=Streblomastix strix TaxID=222440 RepID=A0A5J4XAW8_9EUKA|nr:MAG: hypothetical protein EZS28_000202 [Streblomastix strix]KAA6404270.1 MAG: hypothetical protein EZS28_000203 [Streblomastix strix]
MQHSMEMAILPELMLGQHISPDSFNGSEYSPLMKSAVLPNYSINAENIKRSSCGMPTLKRIGIQYGIDV